MAVGEGVALAVGRGDVAVGDGVAVAVRVDAGVAVGGSVVATAVGGSVASAKVGVAAAGLLLDVGNDVGNRVGAMGEPAHAAIPSSAARMAAKQLVFTR